MTKSEREQIEHAIHAIKDAAAHGNIVDRVTAIEAAVVLLFTTGAK